MKNILPLFILILLIGCSPENKSASKPVSAPVAVASADLLRIGLVDMETNHFPEAIGRFKQIPSNAPEYAEATTLIAKAEDLQKKWEIVQKRKAEEDSLYFVEQRIKETKEKLKKYYATNEDVTALAVNVAALRITEGVYRAGAEPSDKKFAVKVSALLTKAEATMREAHASALEEAFISTGMDAKVSASGSNKNTLRITYVLMSQPLVYKLQKEGLVSVRAKDLGYKKVIYTDGYDNTWTVDLS